MLVPHAKKICVVDDEHFSPPKTVLIMPLATILIFEEAKQMFTG